jgi:hypothetical protein
MSRYRWNSSVEPPQQMERGKCYEGTPHRAPDGAGSRMIDIIGENRVALNRVPMSQLALCADETLPNS